MSKTFWAILATIVIIFGGIIIFNKSGDDGPSNSNAQPTNHTTGAGTSGVTLVEYGDFECPACSQFHPIIEQIKQKYKDQITFQFRHLPLIQIHQSAFAAARAAEAAGKQDKFWEMYDLLFQNQQAWVNAGDSTAVFEQYAGQLGLNVEQFKTDAASPETNDTINADIAEFNKTGAQMSTPTFFLNGKEIQARTVEEFSSLIDAAIAEKTQENQ